MKYLPIIFCLLFGSCDSGGKSSEGPPSSPPEPTGVNADIMKYEAAKLDSLRKLSKDTTTKQKMVDAPVSQKDPLLGTWIWDHTVCCNRRPKTTKDSTADKTTIKITDDHIDYYSGSKLTVSKVYRTGSMDGKKTIRIEGSPYAAVIQFQGDTLMIGYGYMDLQNEFYIRVK